MHKIEFKSRAVKDLLSDISGYEFDHMDGDYKSVFKQYVSEVFQLPPSLTNKIGTFDCFCVNRQECLDSFMHMLYSSDLPESELEELFGELESSYESEEVIEYFVTFKWNKAKSCGAGFNSLTNIGIACECLFFKTNLGCVVAIIEGDI